MVLLDTFDARLKSISLYAAFSCFIIILSALHVNNEKAEMLVLPNKTIIADSNDIWLSLTYD